MALRSKRLVIWLAVLLLAAISSLGAAPPDFSARPDFLGGGLIDVAPTVAHLHGFTMTNVDGRILDVTSSLASAPIDSGQAK